MASKETRARLRELRGMVGAVSLDPDWITDMCNHGPTDEEVSYVAAVHNTLPSLLDALDEAERVLEWALDAFSTTNCDVYWEAARSLLERLRGGG